jgi:hypothetical protein
MLADVPSRLPSDSSTSVNAAVRADRGELNKLLFRNFTGIRRSYLNQEVARGGRDARPLIGLSGVVYRSGRFAEAVSAEPVTPGCCPDRFRAFGQTLRSGDTGTCAGLAGTCAGGGG